MIWVSYLLVIMVGLGGGIAVGSGFVAFITVLDIIPRLTQLTRSKMYIRSFEWSLISGALLFTLADFFPVSFHLPPLVTIFIGVFTGIFIGTLAAGLTEALNVFPILAKRLHLQQQIILLLSAMVLGKIFGSVIQWLLQI